MVKYQISYRFDGFISRFSNLKHCIRHTLFLLPWSFFKSVSWCFNRGPRWLLAKCKKLCGFEIVNLFSVWHNYFFPVMSVHSATSTNVNNEKLFQKNSKRQNIKKSFWFLVKSLMDNSCKGCKSIEDAARKRIKSDEVFLPPKITCKIEK